MLQNNSISNLDCKEIGRTFVIKCLHAAESAFAEDLDMLSPIYTGFLILFAALLGLLIGSFLNVCIYRLPLHETIVRGHSYCPRCRHPLAGADLVPVFSYLLLGGKCRYCKALISPRYARVELLTAAYFGLAAGLWSPAGLALLGIGRPAWLLAWPAATYSLVLTLLAAACFCALLVWAMILWDRGLPPAGLYVFILLPAAGRLALQPGRWVSLLAGLVFAGLFYNLLLVLRLLQDDGRERNRHMTAGLSLLGLMSGLLAIQSVLVIYLIECLLLAIWQRRGRGTDGRTDRVVRFLPMAGVLVGSAAWLLF